MLGGDIAELIKREKMSIKKDRNKEELFLEEHLKTPSIPQNYSWSEDLSVKKEVCPPNEADPIEGVFYRLGQNPPNPADFYSYRKLNPSAEPPNNITECQLRSLSLFKNIESARAASNMPRLKSKNFVILEIDFVQSDGLFLQTGNKSHYSWWMDNRFDILKCKVL